MDGRAGRADPLSSCFWLELSRDCEGGRPPCAAWPGRFLVPHGAEAQLLREVRLGGREWGVPSLSLASSGMAGSERHLWGSGHTRVHVYTRVCAWSCTVPVSLHPWVCAVVGEEQE